MIVENDKIVSTYHSYDKWRYDNLTVIFGIAFNYTTRKSIKDFAIEYLCRQGVGRIACSFVHFTRCHVLGR